MARQIDSYANWSANGPYKRLDFCRKARTGVGAGWR